MEQRDNSFELGGYSQRLKAIRSKPCKRNRGGSSQEKREATWRQSLRIDCRPTEISLVLLNLLNNAVDAVEPLPEKWVEVKVKNVGTDVEIQ